jgi:hypothetical protein
MRTALTLTGSLFTFFLLEFLVFNTSFYPSIAQPDASTGIVQTIVGNELRRPDYDPNQVLSIGDSRMGFIPRYANQMSPGSPYTFATISVGGTTPRCWYYMLRAVDPDANRYSAVMIGMNNYEDAEILEDYANRAGDLNLVISLLGWRDIAEFSNSFHDPELKHAAARDILLKGLVYKIDFQRMLLDPMKRWSDLALYRPNSKNWNYQFVGPANNVANVQVDFQKRTLSLPPGTSSEMTEEFRSTLLADNPPDLGRHSAYMHYWLGRICDRYRGSRTKIVFVRLPRGPFVRPDQPARNPRSAERELAQRPNVLLTPEHYFDGLERPELFMDPLHLNGPGMARFSGGLGREVTELLGPPPRKKL